ncbi:TPA: hypothetical protein ACE6P7_000597 [Neisseria gonorrhoeae]
MPTLGRLKTECPNGLSRQTVPMPREAAFRRHPTEKDYKELK